MMRLTFKGMWAHKRRLVGTFLAITIGVAFLAGTTVLGDTLRSNFDDLFTDANAGTDAVVRSATEIEGGEETGGDRPLVSEDIAQEVESIDGVEAVAPFIQGYGELVGKDGEGLGGNGPPTFAGNWITDDQLNPYDLEEGRPPEADNEVVIDEGAAEQGDLQVGDTTIVQTPEPVEVEIVGIATFGAGGNPTTFTAFTLEAAQQHITGTPDQVSQILVRAEDGVSQSELVNRLEPVIPGGTQAITGEALTEEDVDSINSDFLNFFTIGLTIFAVIALLVATFSIYNTFSIIVAQRSQEAALLRAIGASRGQVLRSVSVEALVIGLVASIAGLAGGVGVAAGLKALFAGFGFPLPTGGVVFKPATVVLGLVVGLVVTVVAGIFPAVRASRVSPMAALRETASESTRISLVRILVGGVMAAGGAAMVLAPVLSGGDDILALAGGGALLTILGMVVLGPTVAGTAARVIGAPLPRLRGVTGSLARENAMRNPRRTSGTAAALMFFLAVVTVFTVFAASVKASIDSAVSQSFGGDLVVSTGNFSGGTSPELATRIGEVPEVSTAVGLGFDRALLDGDAKSVSVSDPAALSRLVDLDVAEGSVGELGPGQLAVSEETAESEGLELGSKIPVTYPDGATEQLSVGAIYQATDLVDSYLIPREVFAPHAAQQIDFAVFVELADGVSLTQGQRAVESVTEGFGSPDVQDREEYTDTVAGQVNQMLFLIYIMLVLAVIIALMGIANTLSLSVHERTRELGLLRAVGETRGQLRAMVRWESVIIATFGAVGGVAIGLFLGWALVEAASSGGELTQFYAPVSQLVVILVVGALVGLLAGIRPARRAAKLNVLDAIATG